MLRLNRSTLVLRGEWFERENQGAIFVEDILYYNPRIKRFRPSRPFLKRHHLKIFIQNLINAVRNSYLRNFISNFNFHLFFFFKYRMSINLPITFQCTNRIIITFNLVYLTIVLITLARGQLLCIKAKSDTYLPCVTERLDRALC